MPDGLALRRVAHVLQGERCVHQLAVLDVEASTESLEDLQMCA